jgi:hypothetical protein
MSPDLNDFHVGGVKMRKPPVLLLALIALLPFSASAVAQLASINVNAKPFQAVLELPHRSCRILSSFQKA